MKVQIFGSDCCPDIITENLEIIPCKVKRTWEYPKVTIDSGRAVDMWQWESEKELSNDLSSMIDQISLVWKPKLEIVKNLCNQYALRCNVTAVIEAKSGERPDLSLTRNNLLFLSEMVSEFSLDWYEE